MEERNEEERGRCLECGEVLPWGRSDMKFCSQSCRNRWHYNEDGRFQVIRKKTIRSLDKNHSLLDSLVARGIRRIAVPDLEQMGYKFECITSFRKAGKHAEYRCYDIRYCVSDSNVFKIERCRQPYSLAGLCEDP